MEETVSVKEGPNYPATYISWKDAVEYCRRLSEREGRDYSIADGSGMEHACRAVRAHVIVMEITLAS